MPEVLNNFEFIKFSSGKKKQIFPWEKWLDGRIYRLKQGTDFNLALLTMTAYVRKAAKEYSVNIRIQMEKLTNSIVIQAYTMEKQEDD